MRKILPAIAIALLIISCKDKKDEDAIPKNSDWNTQNLKSHVKSYEETSYTPDSTGKIGAMDSCCIDMEQYDEKGYNNSWQSKDSKGTITSSSTATRYDSGQLKDIIITANGKKWTSFSAQLGKDGKYAGAQNFDTTGKLTSFYTELKTDEYENATSFTEHKPDSSIKMFYTAEYKNATQIGAETKDSSSKTTGTYKAEFDDKNNVIKSTTTSVTKDSTTTKTRTFKYDSYDEEGNWTQRTTYDEKGKAIKVLKRTYTYYKKD